MKKSVLALSILLSTSAMADYKIIMSGNSGTIKLPESPEPQTDFVSHTFTNCGKTGRFGPSQSQCISSYNGDEILSPEYSFSVTDGIQSWTVPANGNYRIEAWGASGGLSRNSTQVGKGAKMSGYFNLNSGDKLLILVGQKGKDNSYGNTGGGGGSFVTKGSDNSNSTPLIIAGGGAGAQEKITQYNTNMHGWTQEDGQFGYGNYARSTGNGIDGSGGSYYQNYSGDLAGGGGGGFYGSGSSPYGSGDGGRAFVLGGTGGSGAYNNAYGGFGGGGGAHGKGGGSGGGGGFSGGQNGNNHIYHTAGGGGSYNIGSNQDNQAAANTGHGYVKITFIE